MQVESVSAEKQQAVQELREQFVKSQAAFVFNYTGCSCAELSGLRTALRQNGSRLKVVKNTLARRSVAETNSKVLEPLFEGQVAVIIAATDAVGSAKALSGFAKQKEQLEIKGGVFEGALLNAKEIEALASMPSKEQLVGKLLGLLNAPATRLLQTINAPAVNFARLVEAWRDKLEKSGK